MTDWETIEVPKGAFIGWGDRAGQHVTGMVVDYDPTGGTDFKDQPCPLITVDLHETAASFNKAGERRDFGQGQLVNLSIGQAGLKAAIRKADPQQGDLIKITLTGTEPTAKGAVKLFTVQIARAGKKAVQATDEPPF